jgi:RND family efflux transporter, MFP subunit
MKRLPTSIMFAVLVLAGCGRDRDDEKTAAPKIPVRTAVAAMQPVSETIGAIGSVAARPGFVANLTAPAPARIARVNVSPGQTVQRGQALIELDQTSFIAASQGAEASLSAAQGAYDRAQRLAAAGIIPRKELEQAATELAIARGAAANAKRAQELAVIRSPLNGSVTRLTAALGSSVDANQPLVEVTDTRALDLVLMVSPSDAAKLHPGATVKLAAGQGASGEPLGNGAVASVSDVVDPDSRGVAVKVRPSGAMRPLRVGETIFGEIAVGVRSAVTVPAEALVPEGDGFKVFVVDNASIAHARDVTVGARNAGVVEITKGLAAGERVVTYGAYGVEDSAKVVQSAK